MMTRQQRTSKSQHHNRMKRTGYKWYKRSWWQSWRFSPVLVRLGETIPIYHSDHEEARSEPGTGGGLYPKRAAR